MKAVTRTLKGSTAAEDLAELGFDAVGDGVFTFALLEGAKFDEADGGGEFGLIKGGFEAADGIGSRDRDRHLKDLLGEGGDLRDARAAPTEKNARAQIIGRADLFKVASDELEDFFEPKGHDAAEVFEVDRFEGQAELVGNCESLSFDGIVHKGAAVFELELLGAAQGNFQSVSQIVGDVITANGQDAGVFDDAVHIDDVFGGTAADVNDQRAQFFVFVREQCQGGGQTGENNVVHFELKAFNSANSILEAIEISVNDMDIHLDARAQHADGIGDAVLAVHEKVLADGVDDVVLGGEVDCLGVFDDVLNIFFANFAVGGHDWMDATVIESAEVAARHAEINAPNFYIGHLLGFNDGLANVFLSNRRISDLPLANATRARLAETNNVQAVVRAQFPHDRADFGSADFEADNDGGGIKHAFSCCARIWAVWEGKAGRHSPPASGRECCW